MGLSYVFIVCVFNNFHLHSIVTMVTFVKCDANCSTWEIYSMALYRQDLSTYRKVATIAPIYGISANRKTKHHMHGQNLMHGAASSNIMIKV